MGEGGRGAVSPELILPCPYNNVWVDRANPVVITILQTCMTHHSTTLIYLGLTEWVEKVTRRLTAADRCDEWCDGDSLG